MIRDLTTLMAPASEQKFLDHFLEKKWLHVRSENSRRAVSLFPWSDINRLVQSDVLPPERFRVIRANVDLLPTMYRESGGTQRLRPQALQALLSQGASLIINGAADLVPQIGHLSDAIERRLDHRVWVNAYLSFARGSALKPHWDSHDVLVLQVHGRKRWRGYGTPVPYPVSKHNAHYDLPQTVVWEQILEPGDVLYLPRGEVHAAEVEGPHSVHLTIGIETLCGLDFLGWLAGQAARDVVARMDLTRLGGEAALRTHEARLREHLHALLDKASITEFLGAEDAKRKPRPSLSMGLEEELDAAEMIVPTPRRAIPLSAGDGGESESGVVIGGDSYRLPVGGRRVLDILLAHNGLAFRDLVAALGAGADEHVLRQTLIELAKQGLISFLPSISK